MTNNNLKSDPDVILIGAGIMSATLGLFLKELQPDIKIEIYERLDVAASESSDAWNNAGTGHSAFCELNYTPELEDGSIETVKAVKIAESFEISKQFWAYLVNKGIIETPEDFIKSIPHLSFVWGEDNVTYLKKRYDALQKHPLFKAMQYTEDVTQLESWMPLIMEGREANHKLAATYMSLGTDVNFGKLTRSLFKYLQSKEGVTVFFNQEVTKIKRKGDNTPWVLTIKDLVIEEKKKVNAKFIFIGAGGGSLPLLEKSDIPEGKGFGGFPVSGQWLKCINKEIIEKHQTKVYGKASVGSPPMSVPHLDTRIINGEKALLFGPYAGFSTKFLKKGSYLDLPLSIKVSNLVPMLVAGYHNIPLTKYLIEQVMQSPEDRLAALKEYFPKAEMKDWELETAGQRVQVIKKDPNVGGVLEFGTKIVSSADGSLVALLGASPGASTAASIMIDVLNSCFSDKMNSPKWKDKLKQMIPSYGQKLDENESLCNEIRENTSRVLKLK